MDDRRTMSLALAQAESRRLLVEAGCTVLVVGGRLRLRSPARWLAEQLLVDERTIEAEEAWRAESGGWVDLTALTPCRIVVMPAEGVALWRQVGRCLERLFGGPGQSSAAR